MNTINDKVATATSSTPLADKSGEKEQVAYVNTREKSPEIKSYPENNTPTVQRVEGITSEVELDKVVALINEKLSVANDFISFEKDEGSGRNVYSLIDSESKEIIKQFPSEEFLKVSRKIQQYLESNSKKQGLSESIGNLIDSLA